MVGNDGISNLSPGELRALYNTVIVCSPMITYNRDKDEWVPAVKMLCNSLDITEDELISDIRKNGSLGKSGKMSVEKVALFDTNSGDNEILKSTIIGTTEDPDKVNVMKESLGKVKPIMNSLSKHCKRIGVDRMDDITPDISDSMIVITREG
jgi:hypothetical protein